MERVKRLEANPNPLFKIWLQEFRVGVQHRETSRDALF